MSEPNPWRPRDARIIAEEIRAGLHNPEPTIGPVAGGPGLFYLGRINGIYGDSQAGKTWLVLTACMHEIQRGYHVIYIDYEDTDHGLISRLLDMGATDDELGRFHYLGVGGYRLDAMALAATLDEHRPTLVVIDSLGESAGTEGFSQNSDDDMVTWVQRLPRGVLRVHPECGVVTIDHVTRDSGNRDSARGSGRKKDAITGGYYEAQIEESFSRDKPGYGVLIVRKDRLGNRAIKDRIHYSVFPGTPLEVQLAESVDDDQKTRHVDQAILRYIESDPGSSAYAICKNVPKRKSDVLDRLKVLAEQGELEVQAGSRNSALYTRSVPNGSPVPLKDRAGEPVPEPVPEARNQWEPGTSDLNKEAS